MIEPMQDIRAHSEPAKELPGVLWIDLRLNRRAPSFSTALSGYAQVIPVEIPTLNISQFLRHRYCCIAAEFDHPDRASMEFVAHFRRRHPLVPLIAFTLEHSEDFALWALRQHVWDLHFFPLSEDQVEDIAMNMAELPAHPGKHQAELLLKPLRFGASDCSTHSQIRRGRSPDRFRIIVQNYLANHISEKIRCADVASACGLTYLQFSKVFREAFDCTFQEYLTDYRLDVAKRALAEPDIQVGTVAELAGFHDASYFTRVFTRMTGLTPSRYREVATKVNTQEPTRRGGS